MFLGTHIKKAQHQSFNKSLGFIRRNGIEVRLEAPLLRIRKKLTEAGIIKGKIPTPRFI
jgi:hypothetical protein